jgi:hypothetical protein
MSSSEKKANKTDYVNVGEKSISSDLIYAPNANAVGKLEDLARPLYKNARDAERGKKLGVAFQRWEHADAEAEQLFTLYRSRDVMETIEFIETHPISPFTIFHLIRLAEKTARREHATKGAIGKQKKQPYTAIKAKILEFFKEEASKSNADTGMPQYRSQADFIRDAIQKFGITTAKGTTPEPKAVGNWIRNSGLPMPPHWNSRKKE